MAGLPSLRSRAEVKVRRNLGVIWNGWLRPRVLLRPTFEFHGDRLRYHYAGGAANCERTIEVAVAGRCMTAHSGRVLEVGNVMAKFLDEPPPDYTIVDKYEVAEGVENTDVIDFVGGPFDLIVSVSTIEHVGLDETPRDWTKAIEATRHLLSLLAPRGHMLVTWPVNYNRALDDALLDGELMASRVSHLVREWPSSKWRPADPQEAHRRSYGWPCPGGNGLVIAEWHAP